MKFLPRKPDYSPDSPEVDDIANNDGAVSNLFQDPEEVKRKKEEELEGKFCKTTSRIWSINRNGGKLNTVEGVGLLKAASNMAQDHRSLFVKWTHKYDSNDILLCAIKTLFHANNNSGAFPDALMKKLLQLVKRGLDIKDGDDKADEREMLKVLAIRFVQRFDTIDYLGPVVNHVVEEEEEEDDDDDDEVNVLEVVDGDGNVTGTNDIDMVAVPIFLRVANIIIDHDLDNELVERALEILNGLVIRMSRKGKEMLMTHDAAFKQLIAFYKKHKCYKMKIKKIIQFCGAEQQ
jgi:hypothetical protein